MVEFGLRFEGLKEVGRFEVEGPAVTSLAASIG